MSLPRLAISASWSFRIFLCKAADLSPIVCPHCHFSLLPPFFFQDPQYTYCMHVNLCLASLWSNSLASYEIKLLSSC